MTSRLEKLFRPELRNLRAYVVQPSTDMMKLDAMENPYSLPKDCLAKWQEYLSKVSLNRYPDAAADELKSKLQKVLSIPSSCQLMLGNGSDELIQLLCLALLDTPIRKSGKPVVMAPEPSFVMYKQLAVATGLDYVGVPLQADDFEIDLAAMQFAIEKHQPELLFFPYPNNPTGNLFDIDGLKKLVEIAPGLVIFDEAYQPFADKNAIELLTDYDHVLLMRTVSKWGLAGIRLGLLAGNAAWIEQLDKLRLPYNINSLTQATTEFACEHIEVFEKQCKEICKQRESVMQQLTAMPACKPFASQANFILFGVEHIDADTVFRRLHEQNILIKNVSASHPLLANCLRVTIGTEDENRSFINALTGILH